MEALSVSMAAREEDSMSADMSKAAAREPGWYWVKRIGPNNDWEVARRFEAEERR